MNGNNTFTLGSHESIRELALDHLRLRGRQRDEPDNLARSKSVVSLRDIQRVFHLFQFFLNHFPLLQSFPTPERARRAVLLSVALVYYLRLDETARRSFLVNYSAHPSTQGHEARLLDVLEDALESVIRQTEIPTAIALTKGLKENVFLTLVLHRHLDFGLGLVSLDMSYNYLGNDFMRAIMAEVQQLCPSLISLNISYNRLTSLTKGHPILNILDNQGFQLLALDIADNHLDQQSMADLGSAISQNRTLTSLTVCDQQQHMHLLLSGITLNDVLAKVIVLLNGSEIDDTGDVEVLVRSRLVLDREDMTSSQDNMMVYAGQLMIKRRILAQLAGQSLDIMCHIISNRCEGVNSVYQVIDVLIQYQLGLMA